MVDKTKVIRVFEAFAGIGSQRKALTNIKANFSISGMAEWYVPAIISYQKIHNNLKINLKISADDMKEYLSGKTLSMDSKNPVNKKYWFRYKDINKLRIIYSAVFASEIEGNIFDIRTIHKRTLSGIDLLTYSFPCQDLSQQGIQKGMKKGSNTRSGLLWEIEKALDLTPIEDLPKYLLMENVMSLSYKNNKPDFDEWQNKLKKLGYKNDSQILNSSEFGSPQARRRVFMLSSLEKPLSLPVGDVSRKKVPISKILNSEVNNLDILTTLMDKKYITSKPKLTKSNIKKVRLPMEYTTFNSEAYIYDPNFTGPTLTASGANSRIK